MPEISRGSTAASVGVGTTLGNSEAISFGDFGGGIIHAPASEGGVILTYYVGDCDCITNATFRVLYDYAGNAVTAGLSGDEAIEIHPAVFGAPSFKIVADGISGGTSIDYTITFKV